VRQLLAASSLPAGSYGVATLGGALRRAGHLRHTRYPSERGRFVKHHLNTLFVTTQGAYLSQYGEAVQVKVEDETRLQLPLHTLGGIVCFGQVSMSPWLMSKCADFGIAISFLSEQGKFLARVQGFTPGNVLLRREQYRRADDMPASAAIARNMVAAKIATARSVLLRSARDYPNAGGRAEVEAAAGRMAYGVQHVQQAGELDLIRGIEGESANTYFGVFNYLITAQHEAFVFTSRNRRPPLDPVNSLLSFLYAMLGHDARAACESAGLDAQVGFLHRDRPGRPGLALDLMEEFRPFLADRLALTLINRQQVRAEGFRRVESGGIEMNDETRKTVLTAYQKRKQDGITHPFLGEETTVGLMMHLQARLLARHLRGDLDAYPPFVWK
jgi:CRISPR-associated protein Cas1